MNYYNEIKERIIDDEMYARVKDYSKENHRVQTYYEIGKLLSEAGSHYGEGIIKEYSIRLSNDLGKKYSKSTLYYMIKLYEFGNFQSLTGKLSWGHWIEIFSLKEKNKMNYYVSICQQHSLSTRELRERIKSKEYERLPELTKEKLIKKEQTTIVDLVPNPIVIKNTANKEIATEKALHHLILDNIETFLNNLGNGYAFIGSEYKIKIGNRYNYIDFLLFNVKFNCYVVIELKVTELKKDHIGQIECYMNYIDENVKRITHNKTIGIIIVKVDNKYYIKYSSDKRIYSREYILV